MNYRREDVPERLLMKFQQWMNRLMKPKADLPMLPDVTIAILIVLQLVLLVLPIIIIIILINVPNVHLVQLVVLPACPPIEPLAHLHRLASSLALLYTPPPHLVPPVLQSPTQQKPRKRIELYIYYNNLFRGLMLQF